MRQRGPCEAGKESEVLDKGLMSAEVERTRYKNEARRARPAVVAVNASFSRPQLLPGTEPVPFGVVGRERERIRSSTPLNFELWFRRTIFCG